LDADGWAREHLAREVSWLEEWTARLYRRSGPGMVPPPPAGAKGLDPLGSAPGTYVFQK